VQNYSTQNTVGRWKLRMKTIREALHHRVGLTLDVRGELYITWQDALLDSFTSFSCLDNLHSDALKSIIVCAIGSFSAKWSGNDTPDADDVDGTLFSSFSDLDMTATSDHVGRKGKGVVAVSTGSYLYDSEKRHCIRYVVEILTRPANDKRIFTTIALDTTTQGEKWQSQAEERSCRESSSVDHFSRQQNVPCGRRPAARKAVEWWKYDWQGGWWRGVTRAARDFPWVGRRKRILWYF